MKEWRNEHWYDFFLAFLMIPVSLVAFLCELYYHAQRIRHIDCTFGIKEAEPGGQK